MLASYNTTSKNAEPTSHPVWGQAEIKLNISLPQAQDRFLLAEKTPHRNKKSPVMHLDGKTLAPAYSAVRLR